MFLLDFENYFSTEEAKSLQMIFIYNFSLSLSQAETNDNLWRHQKL